MDNGNSDLFGQSLYNSLYHGDPLLKFIMGFNFLIKLSVNLNQTMDNENGFVFANMHYSYVIFFIIVWYLSHPFNENFLLQFFLKIQKCSGATLMQFQPKTCIPTMGIFDNGWLVHFHVIHDVLQS